MSQSNRLFVRSSPVWDQAARDADLTIELPGGVPMFFRRIEKGEFEMGSRGYRAEEEPVHRVVITNDFYLGTFPVTQAQYRVAAECCSSLENSEDVWRPSADRPANVVCPT